MAKGSGSHNDLDFMVLQPSGHRVLSDQRVFLSDIQEPEDYMDHEAEILMYEADTSEDNITSQNE